MMGSISSILGTLAIAGSLFFHLGIVAGTGMFTMRKPSGPDAMGLAGLFFASIAAWGLLAIAAGIAAARGPFHWITDAPAGAVLLAVITMIGLGGLSIVGAGASMETSLSLRTLIGLAAGLVLPAVAAMFIGVLLWMPPAEMSAALWTRFFAIPLAALGVLAWGGAGVMYVRQLQARERALIAREAERERDEQRYREEAQQRDAEHAAELAALPDDTPLPVFLTHLFIDKSEAHHARAIERISRLPDVRRRIEEVLADPVPLQREYCANYIRMCATPDAALAPAVGRAIVLLADDIERAAPSGELTHAKGMTLGILMTAEKFPGARFDAEAQRLRAALEKWPHESTRAEAIGIVDRYLKGEPVEQDR